MYVCGSATGDPSVHVYQPTQTVPIRLVRTARRLKINLTLPNNENGALLRRTYFSDDRCVFSDDVTKQIPRSDVIQLHWAAEFLDYESFFRWLPNAGPLVWTLHDMANFTGGCCYDLGCGKFVQRCGACPQLDSRDESDFSRQVWLRKQRHYSRLNPARVHIVAPSRWMAGEVRRSALLSRFNCSVIPYGLDLDVFQPRNRGLARELLGIPAHAKVVLCLAVMVDEYRKGYHVLGQALDGIAADANIFLLSVGKRPTENVRRFPHAHFEGIRNDRILSFIYSAADVFACPSLADNLPNTIIESIACGTPVVAFDAGGVPDLVRPGITGLLAKRGEATELREAILHVLDNDAKRSEMSANCRRIALEEYEQTIQVRRYSELYEELIG